MAAVTVHSDLGAQEINSVLASTFSPSICHEAMVSDAMILVCFFFSVEFQANFSLSSLALRKPFSSSSLPLLDWYVCISEVVDISPSNLDSSLCFIQPGIWHDVLCI